MKETSNMQESDENIVIEEPQRPESFATVVVETGQVSYDRPDFVLDKPEERNLNDGALNEYKLRSVTRNAVQASIKRHPARTGNWAFDTVPSEDWYELTIEPVGYTGNPDVETLRDAIELQQRARFVVQTDFMPQSELKDIVPSVPNIDYGIKHAGLSWRQMAKLRNYATAGLVRGNSAMRRIYVPPGFFSGPEEDYIERVVRFSEEAAINAECNTELRLNPTDYIYTTENTVSFVVNINYKMKAEYRKMFPQGHPNARFKDVSSTLTINVDLETEHLPQSSPFAREDRNPTPRIVPGKKGFKPRDLIPMVREIEASEGLIDSVTTSEIVQIDTKYLSSFIKGVARPAIQDELSLLVKPLRMKGGSVPGDIFAQARLAIMKFCIETGSAEFYQTLMSECIKGVTTSTKHGKFKGIGFSPKFAAFKQDLGPAYPGKEFRLNDPLVEYKLKEAADALWEYTADPKKPKSLERDNLLSEMMAAHDTGVFNPSYPLIESPETLDYDVTPGWQFDARMKLNQIQSQFIYFKVSILDSWMKEIFAINSDRLDEKAATIREKRAKKSKAVLSDEERDALRTTVLRDSCVPFMNVLPPTVSQLRQQGLGGRDMSMVEAAERLLTQANAMLLRIAPNAEPIESLTLRQRYVTCHRDGTKRSVVMPANRVLRRVQTRFAQNAEEQEYQSVNVDWQPAAKWKSIEETNSDGEVSIEMKLSHLGSGRDSGLRSDWFCFPYDPTGPYNYVLDNAFTSVVTIDIDEDETNLYGIDPSTNSYDIIAIDGEIIRDTVRRLMVYFRDSTDWNTDREQVIVDFEDIVNIRDFKPFRNIPARTRDGDSRQNADFGRYLENEPNAYDYIYEREPEKERRTKKGRTLPAVRNTVKFIRHGGDE